MPFKPGLQDTQINAGPMKTGSYVVEITEAKTGLSRKNKPTLYIKGRVCSHGEEGHPVQSAVSHSLDWKILRLVVFSGMATEKEARNPEWIFYEDDLVGKKVGAEFTWVWSDYNGRAYVNITRFIDPEDCRGFVDMPMPTGPNQGAVSTSDTVSDIPI